MNGSLRSFDFLQKISMSLMGVLVFITFLASSLHTFLWQSSDWLVSTILPAVVVSLTNEERADNAAVPLTRNATLDAAAKLKAEHMAKNEYFSHFSPTGVSPWYWFDQAGYVYAHAGENLAIHFTDSDEVVEAWMNSPTHRQNIVDKKYTEIGVGTAKGKFDGYDTVYVVQLFGTPAIAPVTPTPLAVEEEITIPLEEVEIETETLVLESTPEEVSSPKTQLAARADADAETEVIAKEEVLNNEETVEVEQVAVAPASATPAETLVIETVPQAEPVNLVTNNEAVVVELSTVATSSGLAIANITTENQTMVDVSVAGLATQPNSLLQIVYSVLAVVVVILLLASVILEARHLRFVQAAYGLILLVVMGGLWFFNSLLTTGAVIV